MGPKWVCLCPATPTWSHTPCSDVSCASMLTWQSTVFISNQLNQEAVREHGGVKTSWCWFWRGSEEVLVLKLSPLWADVSVQTQHDEARREAEGLMHESDSYKLQTADRAEDSRKYPPVFKGKAVCVCLLVCFLYPIIHWTTSINHEYVQLIHFESRSNSRWLQRSTCL